MEDPTTIALNLTFFGTLGVAFIMFLGLFAVVVATLVIAGLGRLAAVIALALADGVARAARTATAPARSASPARPASPAPPASAGTPGGAAPAPVVQTSHGPTPAKKLGRKETPQLSADWAAAVARADARAASRAEPEGAPAVKSSAEQPAPAGNRKAGSTLTPG